MRSWPLRKVAFATADGITRFPTAKVFAVVIVAIPAVTETLVIGAEFAIGEVVKLNSCVFHQNSKGGAKITSMTICAEVSAGSRLFPTADRRLNDNFFAHSIVCDIVTVEIAIGEIPFVLGEIRQNLIHIGL
jgi:hypothetical protein